MELVYSLKCRNCQASYDATVVSIFVGTIHDVVVEGVSFVTKGGIRVLETSPAYIRDVVDFKCPYCIFRVYIAIANRSCIGFSSEGD